MSQAPLHLLLPQWFTVALRTWMLSQLAPVLPIVGVKQALKEINLPLPKSLSTQTCVSRLLEIMSDLLAQVDVQAAQKYISLCEALIQFYLMEYPKETTLLSELNARLPPGVSFSLVTGSFLFEPELYYHAHNLYFSEQSLRIQEQWAVTNNSSNKSPEEQSLEPLPIEDKRTQQHGKMAMSETVSEIGPVPIAPDESEHSQADSRQLWFRQIRRRRMQLLKEWETPYDKH